jgi:hypothetical protein
MVPARPGIAFVEYEDAPQAGVAMQGLQGFKLATGGGGGWVGGGDLAPAHLHRLLPVPPVQLRVGVQDRQVDQPAAHHH